MGGLAVENLVVCGFESGSFDLTLERWEIILAERKRLGHPLQEEDLERLFPEAFQSTEKVNR